MEFVADCSEDGGAGTELLGGPRVLLAPAAGAHVEFIVVFHIIDVQLIRADPDNRASILILAIEKKGAEKIYHILCASSRSPSCLWVRDQYLYAESIIKS